MPVTPVPRASEAIVLALAVLSALLGVVALAPLDAVLIGRSPLTGALP